MWNIIHIVFHIIYCPYVIKNCYCTKIDPDARLCAIPDNLDLKNYNMGLK